MWRKVPSDGQQSPGATGTAPEPDHSQRTPLGPLDNKPFDLKFSEASSFASASTENEDLPVPPSSRLRNDLEYFAPSLPARRPLTPRIRSARPVGPDPAHVDQAVDMSLSGRTTEQLIQDADLEQRAAEKQRRAAQMEVSHEEEAAKAVWDENGVPVPPHQDDPEFDLKVISYYSAMAKYSEQEHRKGMEREKKRKAIEDAAKKKDGKSGKKETGDVEEKVGSAAVQRDGTGGSSFAAKKNGPKGKFGKGYGVQEEEEEEDMTDDPMIKNYAMNHGNRQWNSAVTAGVPAFSAMLQRTRDQGEIQRALGNWDRRGHHARVVLADGSGIERAESAKLSYRVRCSGKQLERDVRENGGWIATGPGGSKVRLTAAGQVEGARMLVVEEQAEANEGE